MRRPLPTLLPLAVALFFSAPGHAAWQQGGTRLTPDLGPRAEYEPRAVCTDGAGGALVVWRSYWDIPDHSGTYYWIEATRVDADGDRPPGWSANGNVVMSYVSSKSFSTPVYQVGRVWLVPEGQGGALELQHEGGFQVEPFTRITGYHVSSDGVVSSEPYGRASAWSADIVPTPDGTLIAHHVHGYAPPVNPAFHPLVVAHQNLNGGDVWPPIEIAPDQMFGDFATCSDDAGGAYVTWIDLRDALDPDVYVQRVDATGAIATGWPAAGLEVCGVDANAAAPRIAADGAGGAILAWIDHRSGTTQVHVSHVSAAGVLDPAVPTGGQPVGTTGEHEYLWLREDGEAGAYLLRELVHPSLWRSNVLHHVSAQGISRPGWSPGGRPLEHEPGYDRTATIEPDGDGGVWVTFLEPGTPTHPIGLYVLRLQSDGTPAPGFVEDGFRLSATASRGLLTRTGLGAMVVWQDYRASAPGIYAMRIDPNGPVVGIEPRDPMPTALALSTPRPNPAAGSATVTFTLPDAGPATLEVIDLAGRRIATREVGTLGPGIHMLPLALEPDTPPGVYLLRLSHAEGTRTTRFCRVR